MSGSKHLRRWLFVAALGAYGASASPARAESLKALSAKLVDAEAQADQLGKGIQRPDQVVAGPQEMSRRLVDAEIAFSLGRYEDTATLLYDVVAQGRGAKDYDTALYYMAESMFQRGDKGAARTYFSRLATDAPGSPYYQQSLERLIELSLELHDSAGVDEWLAALDKIPSDQRKASVPYVRGKYAFSLEHYDEALHWFTQVPSDSELGFQAAYLTGTTYVAMKDLGKASQAYSDLVARAPKRPSDRRVMELAQLALGRLYYERDQPSKAIDAYLMIDRKSDLFDDALYEVAWVYVKGKQFDKALRALELLALTDPSSQRLPTVRILEGNLRIRKAQTIHQQQIEGVFTGKEDPEVEYGKAEGIFQGTHDTYSGAHDELAHLIETQADPAVYIAQITGRYSKTFQVNATMPEVAAAWLREEPDVQRVVQIENDLGDIQDNIDSATRYIERLDAVLASPDKMSAFPTLAERRTKVHEVRGDVVKTRLALADEHYDLAKKKAGDSIELDSAHLGRQKAQEAYEDIPNQRAAAIEELSGVRAQLDALEQQASESQVVIGSVEATGVAIRKYIADAQPPVAPELRKNVEESLIQLGPEVDSIQAELDDIRREIILTRDATSPGDPLAGKERDLRRALDAALDEEHAAAAKAMARASGSDKERSDAIGSMSGQARRVEAKLDADEQLVDSIATQALAGVKAELDKQKQDLARYKTDFDEAETESRTLGGTVLGQSFREVKSKFYDVIVRADVGVIDVSWSRKEEADDELKRLNLEKQREVKQIKDEFRDIFVEQEQQQQQPAPKPEGGAQ